MKKSLSILSLLVVAAFTATASPQEAHWKYSTKGSTDIYVCNGLKGDFTAKLQHEGQPIIRKGKAFSLSITTTSNANTPHKGFANEFGTGLLSTGNPYADPQENAGDNAFALYIGSGQDIMTWRNNDQRKVELHLNNANNAVSNYALNHRNDGYKSTLTLSFTLSYTPAQEGNKSRIELSANKGSDVTFDPMVIEGAATGVLFEQLQNGGTISAPEGSKTDLRITSESDRMVITRSHYILAGLSAATLLVLCMAFFTGKVKKKKKLKAIH